MHLEQTLEMLFGKLIGWGDAVVLMLPNLIVALLVIAAFGLANRLSRRLMHNIVVRLFGDGPLGRLAINVMSFLLLSVGFVVALSILHLDKAVMSLLAGVGVVGLALGFAFQDIAANFMAGVLILLRRPLRVGDVVETNGFVGRVTAIDLRNTIVRTWSGQDVMVPNKQVFQNPLTNYSLSSDRRVELTVGVSYGDDLDEVRRATLDGVSNLPNRDNTRDVELFFTEFGDSSINFELHVWLNTADQGAYLAARSEAVMAIKRAFDQAGITIPFPIRTLDFGIKGGKTLSEVLPGTAARGIQHTGGDQP